MDIFTDQSGMINIPIFCGEQSINLICGMYTNTQVSDFSPHTEGVMLCYTSRFLLAWTLIAEQID